MDDNSQEKGEQSRELIGSLNNLTEALNAANKVGDIPNGSAISFEDLTPIANVYLTEKSKKDMAVKSTLTISPDGKNSCIYLCVRVKNSEIQQGVKKISSIINELSEQNLIHSTLAPVSRINLAQGFGEGKNCVVLGYVLVPNSVRDSILQKFEGFAMNTGNEGIKTLDSIDAELEPGEFLVKLSVPYKLDQIQGVSLGELVSKKINTVVSMLPEGTYVRSNRRLPTFTLTPEYEVKLYNPLMQQTKRIELQYAREAIELDGNIKEFSVLTGIKYFDKDDNELYNFN